MGTPNVEFGKQVVAGGLSDYREILHPLPALSLPPLSLVAALKVLRLLDGHPDIRTISGFKCCPMYEIPSV